MFFEINSLGLSLCPDLTLSLLYTEAGQHAWGLVPGLDSLPLQLFHERIRNSRSEWQLTHTHLRSAVRQRGASEFVVDQSANPALACSAFVSRSRVHVTRPLDEEELVSLNLEVQRGRVAGGAQFKCQ